MFELTVAFRKYLQFKRKKGTHRECPIVESVISVSFEEISVTTIDDRGVEVVRKAFPIRDQFRISVLHRWFLHGIEPPEFATLVEIDLPVSGPGGHGIDVIRNSCETFADFLRVITVHSLAHVSPIFRALYQHIISYL